MELKLRKIGNSIGVILPKDVITSYNIGDKITLNVITSKPNVITKNDKCYNNVITKKPDVITDLSEEEEIFLSKYKESKSETQKFLLKEAGIKQFGSERANQLILS